MCERLIFHQVHKQFKPLTVRLNDFGELLTFCHMHLKSHPSTWDIEWNISPIIGLTFMKLGPHIQSVPVNQCVHMPLGTKEKKKNCIHLKSNWTIVGLTHPADTTEVTVFVQASQSLPIEGLGEAHISLSNSRLSLFQFAKPKIHQLFWCVWRNRWTREC